jgi:FkbM family methyltransferase
MQNSSFTGNLKKGILGRFKKMLKSEYSKAGLGWLKVKQLKHLPPGKPRNIELFGHTIHFTTPPEFLHGLKEIFEEEVYLQDLPRNAYVLDCGANIGLSVIYIKQHYPDANVVAFEPDDTNFGLLEKNVQSFGYSNVTLRKEAVWIANTELNFSDAGSMSSKIEEAGGNQTKLVKAIRLKDLLTRRVDFLKIDIEGAEYAVLNDIKENLHHVQNMFLEYHGDFNQNGELSNIFQWIHEQGFSYYIKEAANVYPTPLKRGQRDCGYDVQLNIFCFRK